MHTFDKHCFEDNYLLRTSYKQTIVIISENTTINYGGTAILNYMNLVGLLDICETKKEENSFCNGMDQ